MAHNGMLATVFFRLSKERTQLSRLVNSLPGGREAAYAQAAARKNELEAAEALEESSSTPIGTPRGGTPIPNGIPAASTTIELEPKGLGSNGHGSSPFISGSSSSIELSDLRKRVAAKTGNMPPKLKKRSMTATEALPRPAGNLPQGTSLEPFQPDHPRDPDPPSPLAWHPDEAVSILARNIDAMEDELRSNGAKGLIWPQNVTYLHFVDYLFLPTLVYQLEYPRTNE